MTFFHFTSKRHLPFIQSAGFLRPSESNVGSPTSIMPPAGRGIGPDVVWLLDTPEIGFNHGLFAQQTGKDAIRFEVDVPAIRWIDWEPQGWMNPEWRRILLDSAGGAEAASHWYVWPSTIPDEKWVAVTDMTTGEQMYSSSEKAV